MAAHAAAITLAFVIVLTCGVTPAMASPQPARGREECQSAPPPWGQWARAGSRFLRRSAQTSELYALDARLRLGSRDLEENLGPLCAGSEPIYASYAYEFEFALWRELVESADAALMPGLYDCRKHRGMIRHIERAAAPLQFQWSIPLDDVDVVGNARVLDDIDGLAAKLRVQCHPG